MMNTGKRVKKKVGKVIGKVEEKLDGGAVKKVKEAIGGNTAGQQEAEGSHKKHSQGGIDCTSDDERSEGAASLKDRFLSDEPQDNYSAEPSPERTDNSAADEDANSAAGPGSTSSLPSFTKDVPLHGSGVPTDSNLHHVQHDIYSTHIMSPSPNTGSYM